MCYFWNENMNVLGYLNENEDKNGNQYTDEIVEVPQNSHYIVITGRIDSKCKLAKLSYKPTSILLKGKTIVNLGDSIFGNIQDESSLSCLISQKTFSECINCAFGGTKMIDRRKMNGTSNGYEQFDFEILVNAIVNNDYTNQFNAINWYTLPSYFKGSLTILEKTDFSAVDIITLNFSTNDYTFGEKAESLKAIYIETITKLQTAFPNLTIVIISPTWRCWLNDDGSFKEDSNTKIWFSHGDSTLIDYCNILEETAKELNVQYIDIYNIGINKNNWNYYFTVDDTTHQNLNGRKRISDVISKQLI